MALQNTGDPNRPPAAAAAEINTLRDIVQYLRGIVWALLAIVALALALLLDTGALDSLRSR
jgi:hypothetical protein